MLNSVCQNDPLHLPCVHILPCSVTRRNCDKAYSFQQVLFCEHSAQVNIFYMMSNSCDISLYQLSCACYPTTEKVTVLEKSKCWIHCYCTVLNHPIIHNHLQHILPLDFFDGFFTFFALTDFGVFFCDFGVCFAGVSFFFFFLAGYHTTSHKSKHNCNFISKALFNISLAHETLTSVNSILVYIL